jgi:hypothetical protein
MHWNLPAHLCDSLHFSSISSSLHINTITFSLLFLEILVGSFQYLILSLQVLELSGTYILGSIARSTHLTAEIFLDSSLFVLHLVNCWSQIINLFLELSISFYILVHFHFEVENTSTQLNHFANCIWIFQLSFLTDRVGHLIESLFSGLRFTIHVLLWSESFRINFSLLFPLRGISHHSILQVFQFLLILLYLVQKCPFISFQLRQIFLQIFNASVLFNESIF